MVMIKPNIFLVEDDNILSKTTEWRIRKAGYEFSGRAAGGKEAVGSVGQNNPDIVLIDIDMHGEMDGIATADTIRTRYAIPMIFITSCMDREIITRANKLGPKGYLVKPFDDKDLIAAIDAAFR